MAVAIEQTANERAADRRARALFEGIDDAVFVHDLDGNILDANPAACRRLGYTREEFLRLKTSDIDDPEFAAGFEGRLEKQLAEGRLTCEGRHRTKDGRIIPVDINTSFLHIDGKPVVLAVIRDITRRKLAERRRSAEYDITRILAESTRVRDATPRILTVLGEGVGWDVGAIWTVDRSAKVLRCVAFWHRPDVEAGEFEAATRARTIARDEDLPGKAWARGETVWMADASRNDLFVRAEAAAKVGLRAALAIPIGLGSEVLGVIEFFSLESRQPDDSLLRMLRSVVSQIGQFIQRKRVEKQLRDSEAFYHSLVESLPQNIIRKNRDGVFTFTNQRFLAILGLPSEQVFGKTDYDLFPKELADKYRRDDQYVIETGKTIDLVEEHRTPFGEKLYVQIIKSPIYDSVGNLIGTQVIFWDVTERKRGEEALAESERRYRQLTEAALDAIVVADQQGQVRLFNKSAERTFGYEAAEVVGRPLELLMPAKYHADHQQGLRRFVETRQPKIVGRTIELTGRRKDGTEFPLELSLTAIDLGDEVQFLGAIRDLTERNRIRAVLVQSEKLASIGLLSAGVAHEINNPLAYVSNNLVVLERDNKALMRLVNVYESAHAKLAQADPAAAARAKELADDIDLAYVRDNLDRVLTRTREGVQRVTKIVQSLRGLARTSQPQLEEASIPDIVDMSLDMLRGRLQRHGTRIELDFGQVPKIYCVTTQIGQVMLNLLMNAAQAIEAAERAEGLIRVATRMVGERVAIEVSDNGTGIDPQYRSRLLDPFFTTKPVGEGTGLGLYISHNIIDGHGGRIEVDSEPGQGSTFRIYLPLNPQKGPA